MHGAGISRAAPTQEHVLSASSTGKVPSSLRYHAALQLLVLRTDMLSGHPYSCPSYHLPLYSTNVLISSA